MDFDGAHDLLKRAEADLRSNPTGALRLADQILGELKSYEAREGGQNAQTRTLRDRCVGLASTARIFAEDSRQSHAAAYQVELAARNAELSVRARQATETAISHLAMGQRGAALSVLEGAADAIRHMAGSTTGETRERWGLWLLAAGGITP